MRKEVIVLALLVILVASAVGCTNSAPGPSNNKPKGVEATAMDETTGICGSPEYDSGNPSSVNYAPNMTNLTDIISIELTLIWTDDHPEEPDKFAVNVTVGNKTASKENDAGAINLLIKADEEGKYLGNLADVKITIECKSAGSYKCGPLGIYLSCYDPGNEWKLTVKIKYMDYTQQGKSSE